MVCLNLKRLVVDAIDNNSVVAPFVDKYAGWSQLLVWFDIRGILWLSPSCNLVSTKRVITMFRQNVLLIFWIAKGTQKLMIGRKSKLED